MKKQQLADQLARQARLSRAAAADRLDKMVHDILSNLRKGKPATLPGLGTFTPGPDFKFEPEKPEGKRRKE
jgi:nucleoid DNA-binding protein